VSRKNILSQSSGKEEVLNRGKTLGSVSHGNQPSFANFENCNQDHRISIRWIESGGGANLHNTAGLDYILLSVFCKSPPGKFDPIRSHPHGTQKSGRNHLPKHTGRRLSLVEGEWQRSWKRSDGSAGASDANRGGPTSRGICCWSFFFIF
jgi:hypothetical protein